MLEGEPHPSSSPAAVFGRYMREIGHNLDTWRLTHPASPSPFAFNPEVGVTTSDDLGEW